MSDAIRIAKERGDIVILPEIEALARGFDPQITVTEIERPEVVNVLEWAMAASVVVFFAKPFFESMMKELGKAAGEGIVAAFKKQFAEAKEKSPRLYSPENTKQMTAEKNMEKRSNLMRTLGKQYAPLEIEVEYQFTHTFRFVFPASLEERDFGDALKQLESNWETIIQKKIEDSKSGFSFGPATSTPIDYISVYVPTENRWLSRSEMVKYLQSGAKI